MRYCGEYQDYESGLIYLRARYYNPQLGRFINEDPHWNPDNMVYGDSSQNTDVKSVPNYSAIIQSSNLYPYCANNPIRFVDPSGNLIISTLAICLIAGAVSMGTVGGFIGNSLAEQNGIAGWEKAAYITGSTVAGAAIGATCGYLIAPAVASATGIAGVSVTASGVSFAASGTLTASAQRLYETTRTHIFSNDHISDGIMSLGTNEVDIFNRIYQIANDSSSKWQAGSNEIRTTINSVDATIRFFVENNEIININAFVGYSERVIGNLIK